jgi:superfamily I DNA/RNA helicase
MAGLNSAQREAVVADSKALLVLAGAGSGKTRVITARVAWHIAQGVRPDQIAAVTFTNKAAREMRVRISKVTSDPPFIGTFHRLGLRIIRRNLRRLGFRSSPGIIDRGDQMGILRETLRDLGLAPSAWDLRDAMDLVMEGRANRAIHGEILIKRPHGLAPVSRQLVERFVEGLRALNAVDFEDLLLLPLELMRDFPDEAKRIQSHTRYLLVDEFQDTNEVQMALVRRLVEDGGVLTAVGDDDQSIYAFRGARVENVSQFEDSFKDCRIVRLEENYRSVAPILDLANKVIVGNQSRLGKTLRCVRKEEGSVQLIGTASEASEAEFVAEQIQRMIKGGISADDVAVLYRANRQATSIEVALAGRGLPFVRLGGTSLFERKEIRDALAWLNLLVDRSNDLAFRRAVLAPVRGVGAVTIESIGQRADQNKSSMLEAAESLINGPNKLQAKTQAGLREMIKDLKDCRAVLRQKDAADAFMILLDRLNFRSYLISQADTPVEGSKRFGRIMALVNILRRYLHRDKVQGVESFLEDILLVDNNDAEDEEVPVQSVTLMTMHAAKGLEFDHVFLVGLEEGIIPHERSLVDRTGIAEERRLLYVGITRARLNLVMSYVRRRENSNIVGEDRMTRFLRTVGLRPRLVAANIQAAKPKDDPSKSNLDRLRALLGD